jgi:hypothetical protein
MHGIAGYFESTLFCPTAAAAARAAAAATTCGAREEEKEDDDDEEEGGGPWSPPLPPAATVPPPPPAPGLVLALESAGLPLAAPSAAAAASSPSGATSPAAISDPDPDAPVMLSIVPHTHTPGMQSWFPLFFPLSAPIRVLAGQTITLHLWRYSNRNCNSIV